MGNLTAERLLKFTKAFNALADAFNQDTNPNVTQFLNIRGVQSNYITEAVKKGHLVRQGKRIISCNYKVFEPKMARELIIDSNETARRRYAEKFGGKSPKIKPKETQEPLLFEITEPVLIKNPSKALEDEIIQLKSQIKNITQVVHEKDLIIESQSNIIKTLNNKYNFGIEQNKKAFEHGLDYIKSTLLSTRKQKTFFGFPING